MWNDSIVVWVSKNIVGYFIILLLTILVVLSIAHQTTIEVSSKEELRTLSCGWPLEFILNNQDWRDPPYPYSIRCFASQLGDPVKISWQPFFLNILIFYFSAIIIFEMYRFVSSRDN